VLIRELFTSLKRAETDRMRSDRRLLNAIINTEETEKKRFAKDLHDGLGPLLSTVKMSLSALIPMVSDNVGKEILANTNHVVNEALSTIKEIANNMSPHVLTNLGVASAISTFAAKVNQARGVSIDFRTNMEGERFDTDKEVVMYRAACELINNGMKHSGASRIEMDLHRHQKIITLQYLDNGRGFDTEKLTSEEAVGMGIPNIETRVRAVDGVFLIESSKGKGTSALIRVNY
jgi:signal transduction histidine kinase